MNIFPAIDLIDGQAVRLQKGDYDKKTVYNSDPVSVAVGFKNDGANYLHLVDLDGAKSGKTDNFDTVREIVKKSGLKVHTMLLYCLRFRRVKYSMRKEDYQDVSIFYALM